MDQYRTINHQHPMDKGGIQQRYKFPNGWGASVIQYSGSYGGDQGLWEVAVVDRADHLNYTTPVTDDVLGWLTWDEVQTILQQIAALPTAPEV